jgi:uncharacterized membrane protein (DUF485 family)
MEESSMERNPKHARGKTRFEAALNTMATRLFVMFAIYAVVLVAAWRPHWVGTALRSLIAAVRWLGV